MDKNKHIRLDHSDHLTKEEMIRYVNDQLSAREKHQVEKHTIGCDLCAEALEGVMAMKDTSALRGILEKIDRRVLGQEQRKTGPTILWMDTRVRVAVAAGAALLVGCIWFFNRNLDEAVNENTISQTLPVTEDKNSAGDSLERNEVKSDTTAITSTTGKEGGLSPVTVTDGSGSGGKDMGPGKEDDKLKQEDKPNFNLTETNRKDKDGTSDYRSKQPENTDLKKSGEVVVTKTEKTVTTTQSKEYKLNKSLEEDIVVNSDKTKTVSDADQKVLNDVEEKSNNEKQEIIVKKKEKEDKKLKSTQKQQELEQPSNTGGSYGFTNVPPQSNPPVPQDNTVVNGNTNVTLSESSKPEPKKDEGSKNQKDTVSKYFTMLDSVKTGDELRDGVDDYNGRRYTEAEGKFKQSLKTDPKDRESLYYLGATYLEQNKPALAIEQFDKVIALGKGAYYDESRYKKSEALIMQGKKPEAKKILQELIKENGPMKNKAVDLEKK